MKLPRDLSGKKLAESLHKFGYTITRQKGSHIRLTTHEKGEHHITIPAHEALRIGTLSGICKDVAGHLGLGRDEFIEQLFRK